MEAIPYQFTFDDLDAIQQARELLREPTEEVERRDSELRKVVARINREADSLDRYDNDPHGYDRQQRLLEALRIRRDAILLQLMAAKRKLSIAEQMMLKQAMELIRRARARRSHH